ncbi:MAG: hypothetical protein NZ699_16985 [Roseiflexus sp.]|nr:hypothetical protein [Roseiflexus sp.]MDW8233371.1 hypothetical protein [Roseiflexaceae bacterium]
MSSFEHIIHRHGDDLYRLAILLTLDPAAASALVRRVARSFRDRHPADALDVAQAMLEHARTRRNLLRRSVLPGWTTVLAVKPEDAPLLAAIARLPDALRFALGMAVIHSFDAENRSSHTIVGQEWRALMRDALLLLAPAVDPAINLSLFDLDRAPKECRTICTVLTLNPKAASDRSEVRGHLALCETCRQAARDWRGVAMRVEEALRDALRPVRLPADVAAQAIAAARPDTRFPVHRMLESGWLHRALLPLAVLFLIALIVWPRGNIEESPMPAAPAYSLRELLERAEQTLYTPSPGEGGWQGEYLIRWTFVDQTYANLRGNLWIDRETGQHRIQLVHQQGGAPYEFQLADSRGRAWYAVAPAYSATLGLPFEGEGSRGIRVDVDADTRQRLLRARLNSGAWATPRLYLAQARTAEVQSWGRRQLDDGAQVEVIGFRGVSLLGFPPDALNAGDTSATILLTIDTATGALREIRELIGPPEGEQASRTVWTFDGGREVDPREEARIFGIAFAWNGRGTFIEQDKVVFPSIPLVPSAAVISLEQAMREMIALPDPPPDTVEAILTRHTLLSDDETWYTGDGYIAIYAGSGRRLIIRAQPATSALSLDEFIAAGAEQTRAGPYEVWLRPGMRWNYQAMIVDGRSPLWGSVARIEAQGYMRTELLTVLASLDVMTPQRYEKQRAFFTPD